MSNVNTDLSNSIALDSLEKSTQVNGKYASVKSSWLNALMQGLNKLLDATAKDMQKAANAVTKDDPSTTTDFQVISQQFSMLMNTAQTVVKTIGEANANAARKQ